MHSVSHNLREAFNEQMHMRMSMLKTVEFSNQSSLSAGQNGQRWSFNAKQASLYWENVCGWNSIEGGVR